MKRRQFLDLAAKGAVAGTAMGVASACSTSATPAPPVTAAPKAADKPAATEIAKAPAVTGPAQSFEWNMATSWPVALDTIYGGAQTFAERVAAMTGGKFKITPRPASDPQGTPGTQVLDGVSQGAVPMGHTASYYYVGKSWVCQFATCVPFGFNTEQQNAWLFEGGALKLIQDYYGKKFNIINFPAGNTGAQWGGWWRDEIKSLADLKGKKMRIPGMGGQIMSKLGVNPVTLAGGEIFQALQTGAVDAAEWVGPYDDEKLGLNKVAKFYHYPGFWEPAPTLDVLVNLNEWGKLPKEYQEIIKSAAHEANTVMISRYNAKNPEALAKLQAAGTVVKPFPQDVLDEAQKQGYLLLDEQAAKDPDVKAIYEHWKAFRDAIRSVYKYAEMTMQNFVMPKV